MRKQRTTIGLYFWKVLCKYNVILRKIWLLTKSQHSENTYSNCFKNIDESATVYKHSMQQWWTLVLFSLVNLSYFCCSIFLFYTMYWWIKLLINITNIFSVYAALNDRAAPIKLAYIRGLVLGWNGKIHSLNHSDISPLAHLIITDS